MGALIIIPAATAKRLANNLTTMLVLAITIAVDATVLMLIASIPLAMHR